VYTTLYQQYTIRLQERADELSQLYRIGQSSLSSGSKNEVKAQKNYLRIKTPEMDLSFGKLSTRLIDVETIIRTQHTNRTKYKEDILPTTNNQSVEEYYEYFQEVAKNFSDVGLKKPKKKEQIVRFLTSLNRDLYADLHRDINNSPQHNIQKFKTLQ
jgi:hypothetical protein